MVPLELPRLSCNFRCFPSVFLPSCHSWEDWLSFGSYAGPLLWVAGAHPWPSFGLRVTCFSVQLFKHQEKLVMHTLLEGSLGGAGFSGFQEGGSLDPLWRASKVTWPTNSVGCPDVRALASAASLRSP